MHVHCLAEIPQNSSALTTLLSLFYFFVIHFKRSHLQLPAGKCDQSPADGVNAAIRF